MLAIERLTREKEFFVLERRDMNRLTAEKDLQGMGESAFWSGSYLLEGIVDRDGYSKATVTINARLVPPRGGAPALIEVSGSRTNMSETINLLANKVAQALKLGPLNTPWNPAEEAEQYFDEAKWAYRWGMLREAQAASEASWALGNKRKEVAELRIRVYEAEAAPIGPLGLLQLPHLKSRLRMLINSPWPSPRFGFTNKDFKHSWRPNPNLT